MGVPRVYNISGLAASVNGSRQKVYSLNSKAKRTIQSSLVKQWQEKKSNITFLTFTFKRSHAVEHVVTDQKLMNVYIGKLLENFKKSYGLHSYIWVSELTKIGTIHYHAVLDFPKLKKKDYEKFCQYTKESFRNYLVDNGCNIDHTCDYSNVGLPSRYAADGSYRGAVVRNLEAVLVYISGYLKKSDREETKGRIYAISRNVLEKPIKSFAMEYSFRTQQAPETVEYRGCKQKPHTTYTHQYCSVDYYKHTFYFEEFFYNMNIEISYVTASDLHRKADTKETFVQGKCRNLRIEAIKRMEQYRKDNPSYEYTLLQQLSDNEDTEDCVSGSMDHKVINHRTPIFNRYY